MQGWIFLGPHLFADIICFFCSYNYSDGSSMQIGQGVYFIVFTSTSKCNSTKSYYILILTYYFDCVS